MDMKIFVAVFISVICGANLRGQEAPPKREYPTRYGLLFHVFEFGVPDPKPRILTGRIFQGDLGEVPAAHIAYWAAYMAPTNKEEETEALRFLGSSIKEVRLIAGWALMKRLEVLKGNLPEGLRPIYTGKAISDDELERLVTNVRKMLDELPNDCAGKGVRQKD